MRKIVRVLVISLFVSLPALQRAAAAAASPGDARVEELRNLRFGMFICWSFSTFSGKEWTRGVTNIDLFAAKA